MLEDFLPCFNERFRLPTQQKDAAYGPLDPDVCFDRIFCYNHWRRVGRINTLKYRWHTLRLLPNAERANYAGAMVESALGAGLNSVAAARRAHHPFAGGSTTSRHRAELKRRSAKLTPRTAI